MSQSVKDLPTECLFELLLKRNGKSVVLYVEDTEDIANKLGLLEDTKVNQQFIEVNVFEQDRYGGETYYVEQNENTYVNVDQIVMINTMKGKISNEEINK